MQTGLGNFLTMWVTLCLYLKDMYQNLQHVKISNIFLNGNNSNRTENRYLKIKWGLHTCNQLFIFTVSLSLQPLWSMREPPPREPQYLSRTQCISYGASTLTPHFLTLLSCRKSHPQPNFSRFSSWEHGFMFCLSMEQQKKYNKSALKDCE